VRAAIYETGRLSRQSRTRDDVFESSVAVECTPRLGASVRTTRDGRCVLASATCAHLHVSCPCASPWTYARTRLPRISPIIGADEHLHTLTHNRMRALSLPRSMMASLVDRAAFHKTPAAWYKQEPQADVLQVLALIKSRLKRRQIILVDFVSQFDSIRSPATKAQRMRTGFITRENFRRALDSTGCLRDLSEDAFAVLVDTFTENRDQPEFRDQNFNYMALCEVLQDVSLQSNSFRNGTMLLAEKYEILRQQLLDTQFQESFRKSLDDAPLARQPLSEEGELRFQSLKRAIMHTIFADRVSARELLGDFDPYLNTSVSWMKKSTQRTPMICLGSGCISRSQFLRGMSRVTGRMFLTEEDLNLIFNKYKKNGAFNYLAFCHDVDPGGQCCDFSIPICDLLNSVV